MANSFLCKFKKRMEKHELAVSDTGVNTCIDSDSDVFDNAPVDTVLTSMKLAASYFNPQYLYSLNECRLLAVVDPSSITTSKYWDHHRTACTQFKDLDLDTKTVLDAKVR